MSPLASTQSSLFLEMEVEVDEAQRRAEHLKLVEQCKRQVRFSPAVRQIIIPSEGDVPADTIWYNVEELMNEARADVKKINLNLKEGKITEKEVYSGEMSPCGRGLEAYLQTGELRRRQRRRKGYLDALIRKRETLLTLSNDKDEVAERLEQFLSEKSKRCKGLAQALGVQDSIDARAIYEKVDMTKYLATTKDSSSEPMCPLLAKQNLITAMMRSHAINHPNVLAVREQRAL